MRRNSPGSIHKVSGTAEFAVGVYEDLTAAGTDLGVVNAGYYTIESMRLDKAYRAFGRELTPDYNPVEAGLLFACKLRTGVGFLGREAVERARAAGPGRRGQGSGWCRLCSTSPM